MYAYELQRVLYVNKRKLNVINRNYFLPSELVCRIKKKKSGVRSPNIKTCKNYDTILRSVVILNSTTCIYDNSFFLNTYNKNHKIQYL